MDYQIRPATEQDLLPLLRLMEKHATYEQAAFTTEGKMARLSKALFQPPVRLYCEVVLRQELLVGYVTYTFDFSTWEAAEFMYMDCLFLSEEARGAGIGQTVLLKLRQLALARGCVNIQWQTPVFNEGAIRFYNRMGAIEREKARFTWI